MQFSPSLRLGFLTNKLFNNTSKNNPFSSNKKLSNKNLKQLGDGGLDYEVRPGYLPTASPSEQSTRSGKSNDTKEYLNCKLYRKHLVSYKESYVGEK